MKTTAIPSFTRYQGFVVAILAFLQFTIILDFMILSPLGAILLQDLNITTRQFGLVVSVYAFSAGASGLMAAGFADRFDRKNMLLFFYAGFLVGTLLCALAPTYHLLLAARIITGLFGGVIGSITFAIIADIFPFSMRGRVMGFVQTAFAGSQVLGIPLGLFLSNHWGWHMPFVMIFVIGAAVGLIILKVLRPMREHLLVKSEKSAFGHLRHTLSQPRHWRGFTATIFLTTGGFMLMPFASAFSVNNLGITLHQLPLVYLITGIFAMAAGPMLGRLSDAVGKIAVFVLGSSLTMVMVLIYCNLGVTPLWGVIGVNILLFIGISGRMVSAQALMSAIPSPQNRGSFMSINASVQQVSGGVASSIAGLIVYQTASGHMERYPVLGYVVAGSMAVTMALLYGIHRMLLKSGDEGKPASG